MTRRAALAAALASFALGIAAPARATPDTARLDRIAAAAGFAGVALVGQGDALVWERGVGTARDGRPHSADSRWRLASVTKQLTALIVMQEVAAGRLDLDAPMALLWPGWPAPDSAAITPRMLLRHASGLADPAESKPDSDGIPEFYRRAGLAADPSRAAAVFCAQAPRARAGSGYHYNNCDFIVLGALLERLTGRPFAALLQERIAAPLGITSLGLFPFDGPAAPHVPGRVGGKAEPALNLGSYGAAGSAYIAPRDLWRFDRALMEHRLLDRVQTQAMWTGDPALGFAALGSWVYATRLAGCPDTVDLIERRGMIGGIQIRNFLNPASRSAVILFTDTAEFPFGEVGEGRGFAYEMLSAALCPGALEHGHSMTGRLRLGVNIDHVATIRNARGGPHPDPVRAAHMAADAGADGITAHLREDRRHITDTDIDRLMAEIALPLNLEMAATPEMLALALAHRPHAACIVPERREERTTEGGLDAAGQIAALMPIIGALRDAGVRASLFIEPAPAQIEAAIRLGAPVVEFHTGRYAHVSGEAQATELRRLADAAALATKNGIEPHAGHGLTFDNVTAVAAIPQLSELNIGHFLIGEAIFTGLDASVRRMLDLMEGAR